MENIIFDDSPLAIYLRDEGERGENFEHVQTQLDFDSDSPNESPPSSPPFAPFAPTGKPTVRERFRTVETPRKNRLAVAAGVDRADHKTKFIEQFRYAIVGSQLLGGHCSEPACRPYSSSSRSFVPSLAGLVVTVIVTVIIAGAAVVALAVTWLCKEGVVYALVMAVVAVGVSHASIRQQRLRYLRNQALTEVRVFMSRSQDLDSAFTAALALIQEVELVSRGYRMCPPDRGQTRRCARLRKALKACLGVMVAKYAQASAVVRGFVEELDLEKYYDIYDINDLDMSDAMQGFSDGDFGDCTLRTLKIGGARFHILRKMLLCALLSLDDDDDDNDSSHLPRWSAIVDALKHLNQTTQDSYEKLRNILSEEPSFPSGPTAQTPLTPRRERWRCLVRKLDPLSSCVRGMQAKLTLLREEADRRLNQAKDISTLGPDLLAPYDSIGQDLKLLTRLWEDGRAALASGIDGSERRLSPANSVSGQTVVEEEGGGPEALEAPTGEPHTPSTFGDEDEAEAEVLEAVSMPRPRSLMTREERLVSMREDREQREVARESAEASRVMLRELEMVIKLRPNSGPSTSVTVTQQI